MRFAKKLREVVANNFLEIARPEEAPPARKADASFDDYDPSTWREQIMPEQTLPESVLSTTTADEDDVSAAEVETTEVPLTESSAEADTPQEDAPLPLPTLQSGRELLSYVSDSGVIDLLGLLAGAELPPVAFGAEKAAQIVSALPNDLPMRVKRVTVKTTLEAVNRNIDANDIVSDAVLKKMVIGQARDALAEQFSVMQKNAQDEIARLQAEIVRLRGFDEQTEKRCRVADKSFAETLDQMEQVIFFFQPEEQVVETPATEDDLPPFMRSDNVARLLKLNESKKAEADTSALDDARVPETASAATERRTRSRRRIPVAETGEAGMEPAVRDEANQ